MTIKNRFNKSIKECNLGDKKRGKMHNNLHQINTFFKNNYTLLLLVCYKIV